MRKLAKKLAQTAKKTAYRNVGKSFSVGIYEINPPKELLDKKRCRKG